MDKYKLWLLEKEISQNTIKNYFASIKLYFSMYQEINKENMINYKNFLIQKYKPKTVCIRLTGMFSYIDYIGLGNDVKVKMPRLQTQMFVENVISDEEYTKLIQMLKKENYIWYLRIKLLSYTGARISEFIKIKIKHIKAGCIDVYTKAGKIRRIYIPKNISQEILEYMPNAKEEDYISANKKGEQITTRGFCHMMYEFAKKYGINKSVIHPHSFRHRFAINILKNTNDLALTSDLLGHNNIATTRIYLRKSEEEQKELLNKAVNW